MGLSKDPTKASHKVAHYLKAKGYKIVPVNPFIDQGLGEKSYKSLLDVPEKIDIVDIFRPPESVPAIVEDAIVLKNKMGFPKVIWMQLGIVNKEAETKAREAGFEVVIDRCMMREHKRLRREGELDG